LELHRRARRLALQRALQRGQQLAVATVEIGQLGRGLQLDALRVVKLDPERNDGVLRYEQGFGLRS
jgi:hypothetical protein